MKLRVDNKLLVSEMQKNWGATNFVCKIRYFKGLP